MSRLSASAKPNRVNESSRTTSEVAKVIWAPIRAAARVERLSSVVRRRACVFWRARRRLKNSLLMYSPSTISGSGGHHARE